jgi:phage terminase large subunit
MADINTTPVFWANKEAYESKLYRAVANQGSTRSSKTFSLCQLLPSIALTEKKEITVCSPSLPHLKRGARKDFLDILKSWGVYSDKDFNKTDNIYRFPQTGSYIEFFGADEEAKLRGPGRDILYINEANLLKHASYIQLALRTKEVIFIDFNPADEYSWVYDVADAPGNLLIHSTYKNNLANLTKAQIQEIENLQYADENLWKVFGLGLRGTSSETIYTHWKEISSFPADCHDIVYGLDFGFNHPSALVKVGFAKNNAGILSCYVDEQLYMSKLTNDDLVYLMKTECGMTKRSGRIFAETARPEAIEEIRRAGMDIKEAMKAVDEGIKMVKSMPLYITSRSTNVLKEIKSYKWKVDKDGKVLDEPVKFNDDAMDAMRYAIYTRMFVPKRKFADASY